MGRVALIDADILAHKAARRVERPVQWTDRLWTLHSDLAEASARFEGYLSELVENGGFDDVVMALSDYGGPRWRDDVLSTYKQNRSDSRKPVAYFPLRDYVKETYECWERPRLEGDDVLGILATDDRYRPDDEKVIVSIDKDMKTIPGLHLNWLDARNSGDWEPKEITEQEANRFWMRQTLMGDRTDGYKGCPGIGEVRSDRRLPDDGDLAEMWEVVQAEYEDENLGGMALTTARIARILRAEDYDYKAQEVQLWTPPSAESAE